MVEATALPFHKSVLRDECGRYGAAAVVTSCRRERSSADSHTRSVWWPAPLRASALKKHFSKIAFFL